MSDFKLKAEAAVAIVLGASEFPRARLPSRLAFLSCATEFTIYLANSESGLGLSEENITSLFNDGRGPADQLETIDVFLSRRNKEIKDGIRDLFVYYVGHGLFTEGDRAYCLALRSTNAYSIGSTSIRGSDLAHVLKEYAAFVRKFIVLDCCFAASIFKELQAAPLVAARKQIMDELPARGTALLCASSASDVAIAPTADRFTMFSGTMLKVLKEGDCKAGHKLSFAELGHLIQERLQYDFPGGYVRPQVLLPDERRGDISNLLIFPNPWRREANPRSSRMQQEDAETHSSHPLDSHDTVALNSHNAVAPAHPASPSTEAPTDNISPGETEIQRPQQPPPKKPPFSEKLFIGLIGAAMLFGIIFFYLSGPIRNTSVIDSNKEDPIEKVQHDFQTGVPGNPITWCRSGRYTSDLGVTWVLNITDFSQRAELRSADESCNATLRRSDLGEQLWKGKLECQSRPVNNNLVVKPIDDTCTRLQIGNLRLKREE
jgi:hypothetical protein